MKKCTIAASLTEEVATKLVRLGVPKHCRRVIIDLQQGEPSVIYYETFVEPATLDALLDAAILVRGDGPRIPD